ncbi:tRNA selenocysteine associated protein, putative, partial [Ixodes scapularis]
LEPTMDEYFVQQAFTMMGENPVHVKIIRNRITGMPRGYGFLDFGDEEAAQRALLRCNGRPIPNATQGVSPSLLPREFSMFVGDLSSEVDDVHLYHAFSQRYPSVKAAKVVLDQSGLSKGFGFVRFSDESEYQEALVDMQHSLLVGSKPIRVGVANPRRVADGRVGGDGQRVFYRNPSADYY